MNNAPRTLVMLAAGVVLLMAATLAADVVLSTNAISVIGPPTDSNGEVLRSEMTGFNPLAAAVRAFALGTGSAVYGEGVGGVGVYGTSSTNPGVRGSSGSGNGGHFTSSGGYGVYAYTTGTSHWDHGVYASANNGYGVYATSTNNEGVRGEGSRTGVRGIGSSHGVSGASTDGYGVYGWSNNGNGVRGDSYNDYGGSFTSWYYRGLHVQGASGWWDAYFAGTGILVNGDIVAYGSKAGYVVDVARNDGPDPLQFGDVVVITGATDPVLGEIPVPTVRLADSSASAAVLGVVDRMFATPADIDSIPEEVTGAWQELTRSVSPRQLPMEDAAHTENMSIRLAAKQESRGPTAEAPGRFVSQVEADFLAVAAGRDPGIAPGAYVGVVTLGAFKAIRVDASYGSILPGDLLVSSPTPGHAMRAVDPAPGTIIGKALGSLEEGQGSIPVLITLH